MVVVDSPAVAPSISSTPTTKTHWADGGSTDLPNLILLCGYHHRFLHEHEWRIENDPDRKPVFRKPDGQEYPPPRPGLDPRLRQLVGLRS